MTDIRALAKDCGFDRCYVLRMQRFSHYARRLSEASLHVGGRNLVEDPAGAYPWANALLFLIRAYAPLPPEALLSGYYLASNEAYQAANRLIAELEAQGVRSQRCNVPVRECAVANGLGAPLKNGLTAFLGPGEPIGSRAAVQTLAVCLPEPVEYEDGVHWNGGRASARGVEGVGGKDDINGMDAELGGQDRNLADRREARLEFAASCRNCHACERACPVGAIGPDGFHFERCIRAYLSGGEMPEWTMNAMDSLLGCELCQRACPINAAVRPVERVLPEFELSRLLSGDIRPALALVGKNERSGGRLVAQAAVLAANQRRCDLLPLIEALQGDVRPLVRQAAQYAIKKLSVKAQ